MQVFKIPEAVASKYHGCGYALCSVTGGQVVNLIYRRGICGYVFVLEVCSALRAVRQ